MSFSIQQQIRHNAVDIQNYMDDLYKWEDEVKSGDNRKQKRMKNID